MLDALVEGAKGAAVEAVQRDLKDLGMPVKVDGDFGPKTADAVNRVKRKRRRRLSKKGAARVTQADVERMAPLSATVLDDVVDKATAGVIRQAAESRRVAKRISKTVVPLGTLTSVAGIYMALEGLSKHVEGQEDRLMSGSTVQIGIALVTILVPLAGVGVSIWQSGFLGNKG